MPGYSNFELSYSINGIIDYLSAISDHHGNKSKSLTSRDHVESAYKIFSQYEEQLSIKLLAYLNSIPSVRIIGLRDHAHSKRVCTISFISSRINSQQIVEFIDQFNIGIRFGHFYAYRLIQDLQLPQQDGVVRISLLHYNTFQEVDYLIHCLDQILTTKTSKL